MSAYTAEWLRQFCATPGEDPRSYLYEPFTQGDYTYASNAKVVVYVPAVLGVAELKRPDMAAVVANIPPAQEWQPVPECVAPPDVECEVCLGSGELMCNLDHEHECYNCDGAGMVPSQEDVQIGCAHFQKRFLALFQGWEISITGPLTAAHLRLGDARGVVMPIKPKQGGAE